MTRLKRTKVQDARTTVKTRAARKADSGTEDMERVVKNVHAQCARNRASDDVALLSGTPTARPRSSAPNTASSHQSMQVKAFLTPERNFRRDEFMTQMRISASKDLVSLGREVVDSLGKHILANADALEAMFNADERYPSQPIIAPRRLSLDEPTSSDTATDAAAPAPATRAVNTGFWCDDPATRAVNKGFWCDDPDL